MTTKTLQSIRRNTLALATALALASPALMAAANNDTSARVNLSAIGSDTQFNRFIVKYREGTQEAKSAASLQKALDNASVGANQLIQSDRLQKGLKANAQKPLAVGHVRRMSLGADVIESSQKLDRAGAATLMRQIAANPNVEYVEIDAILQPTLTPNDTLYSVQWGYQDADAGIRANQAWDIATGSGIIVAIIDTGITTHSDLNANVLNYGYDFVTGGGGIDPRDGNARDSNPADQGDWFAAGECGQTAARNSSFHGTHVAGTVAAITNNAQGVAGTAFNAKILPVRALAKCGGTTSDIADAITWSSGGTVAGVPTLTAAQSADVINMSLGGGGTCSATSQAAINGAVSRGTTVVVAAGNSNADVANFNPASCDNVIAVASVTSASARSSFSNFGAKIDVSGPGSTIRSTMNAGTTVPAGETYVDYSGTSMASPHVAGTVALIQSRRLALGLALYTPAQVETLLKNTAYALAGTCTGGCGAGIINAKAAVDAAGGGGTTQTYSNTADYTINDNATVDSPIAVSGRTGNAPSNASLSVNIVHTYRGDLKVDLVAPDGSLYNVSNRAGGSADNLVGTYTVNLSTEALNGSWKLRVNDNAAGDVGYINSWSITF